VSLKLEWIPLLELQPTPGNPKKHDVIAIAQSIVRFGFLDPIELDEATGRVTAGHGRISALRALHDGEVEWAREMMGARGGEPPMNVQVLDGGRWAVPVIRGQQFASPAEARAYLLAHNQLTIAPAWDDDLLAQMVKDTMGLVESIPGWTSYALSDLVNGPSFEPELADNQPRLDTARLHTCPACGNTFKT